MSLRFSEADLAAFERKRVTQPTVRDHVRLSLPMPPTVNHSTRPNGRGGKLLTDVHIAFRKAVSEVVVLAGSPKMGSGRLRVVIALQPADKRRYDIDNRCKAVLDALQLAGVFEDDSQVDDLRIFRVPNAIPGQARAEVTIERMRTGDL
jgi:crossover junction endodeoxyribonuclease RusA